MIKEGPQFSSLLVCNGCAHFKAENWREPSGDGETWDSGTHTKCLKLDKTIYMYGSVNEYVPDWCPLPKPVDREEKLTNALENLIIGVEMGWDLEGIIEVAKEAIEDRNAV